MLKASGSAKPVPLRPYLPITSWAGEIVLEINFLVAVEDAVIVPLKIIAVHRASQFKGPLWGLQPPPR